MRKWYYELTALLLFITIAVIVVFRMDFNMQEPLPPQKGPEVSNGTSSGGTASQKWTEGKSLFKSNCASCHNPKAEGTGPALMGVTARWEAGGKFKDKTGKQWMYVWIRNWHDAVSAGNPYAVSMSNSRPSEMNVFVNLNEKQIEAILDYVETPDAYPLKTMAGMP
jgi:mono/diheme cytochrome c family protein